MNFEDLNYKGNRNSYTELNEIYFWTIIIIKWQHLLSRQGFHSVRSLLKKCLRKTRLVKER